jgi:hypothetical protein
MNTRIYGWMLALYPESLRREFGEEMALVFADELRDADFAGFLRIWRRALSEFFWIALPNCASSPAVRVPVIGFAFAIASLGSELLLHYAARLPMRFSFAATLPTFSTFLIPLVVMWACRGRRVISLDLKER